jgi:acyl-CoA thioester hydrolase
MSRHRYSCQMRWGDMDAQGHVNNAVYLDYLQEARVDFLLTGPPALANMLTAGVLVVSHQVEYLAPVVFGVRPLTIELWVDSVGGSRFAVGYEVFDGELLAARARTAVVPFDLATDTLRRLTPEERAPLTAHLEPAPPLRPLPRMRWTGRDHSYPFAIRWSDLDSYGHVNNVKYYDYIQEARIALVVESLGWTEEDVWLVVRQDLDYLKPLDFRTEPFEVRTVVAAIGSRSFTLAAEIRDPASQAVFTAARTVLVAPGPLKPDQRAALESRRPSGVLEAV